MSGVTLFLGPVKFENFELPGAINFGGSQRLTVHNLYGGARVIDSLGREDTDLSFSGVFSGSNATLRARLLDEMRVSGLVYPLTWDVFLYSVIIKRFKADYRAGWWIPYQITCAVLRDEASAVIELATSATATILADVVTAGDYGSHAGVDVGGVQAALSPSDAVTPGSSAYTSAVAALNQTSANVATSISTTETSLTGYNESAAGTPLSAIEGLNAAVSVAGQLSSLVTAQAYLGRAATNLATAST